jgi:hypothetical protein
MPHICRPPSDAALHAATCDVRTLDIADSRGKMQCASCGEQCCAPRQPWTPHVPCLETTRTGEHALEKLAFFYHACPTSHTARLHTHPPAAGTPTAAPATSTRRSRWRSPCRWPPWCCPARPARPCGHAPVSVTQHISSVPFKPAGPPHHAERSTHIPLPFATHACSHHTARPHNKLLNENHVPRAAAPPSPRCRRHCPRRGRTRRWPV